MIFYFGDSGKLNTEIENMSENSGILMSYFYLQKKKNLSGISYPIFLDSGAFSGFTQKKEIELQKYIDFIKSKPLSITTYANLDVIGDDKETWKNQLRMEKAGLSPLPVYHLNDNPMYLDKYIEKYNYICLGGLAKGFGATQRIQFLDRCFARIESSTKQIKVHGFGVTDLQILHRYSWHSVDSTTHSVAARFGEVFILTASNDLLRVTVSDKRKKDKKNLQHFKNICSILKVQIEKAGYKYEDIIENTEIRVLYNAKKLLEYTENKEKQNIIKSKIKPFFS